MEKIVVKGKVVPKGRPRVVGKHAYTPKKTKDYENYVALMWRVQTHREPYKNPVEVKIWLYRGIPKSFNKSDRAAALHGYIRPATRPDIDNEIKSILDGLSGYAWLDDNQVVKLTAERFYSDEPRAEIEVDEWRQ